MAPETFTFFLVPSFSMMAFTAAVEPLRSANRMSGSELYSWTVISRDGQPVRASNGLEVVAQHSMEDLPSCEILLICAGIDAHRFEDRPTMAWLRKIARQGGIVGALCTGTHLLARAGLLGGYKCTIHWEDLESFIEDHPELDVTDDIFEIDRNRITCSGGTAALDLMLHMITLQHGAELAGKVSEQFIHERIRESHDHQRMALQSRVGVSDPKLLAAIGEMEENLEEPLPLPAIADAVGLSTRQLERLFKKHLGRTPSRYYRELRLHHARLMLMQGSASILSIALAAGFVSASHFSRRYREYFGRTPREERRGAV
ncbi:MAG: GlxA family transcriptional regulator [Alphaproteobacteria bacterium]|jgi:AraC family transcriptional regulator, glycine betaine-responsive activator|nr:GlxA family transcriptional regulator [Rhodospirillaceae bacterium]MBT7614012.1 GlxA family transcriptional regulator [Rhodospirillaceae bacterium]MBT7647469.1 GlxA family transcriptional regulator [Rhodospirillaceae bacterium]MDG2483262.1 GlxA family transcriptional regulator [Alphaproteobacteria bacterium]